MILRSRITNSSVAQVRGYMPHSVRNVPEATGTSAVAGMRPTSNVRPSAAREHSSSSDKNKAGHAAFFSSFDCAAFRSA